MDLVQSLSPSLANFWDFTDPFVVFWQAIFKLPDDMMRLSICLIGTYPFVFLHRFFLPSTNARLWFSFLLGLFYAFFCFKWDGLYFVFSGLGTYLICALLPAKYSPKVVVLFSFAVLSYGHWMRYTYHYLQYTVNWCTPMMLFCIKLQSFAWNYHDGQKPPARPFPEGNRIEKLPSPLEYFSWLFFFAGFLTGPVGEFQDYISFTNRSMFKDEPNGQIPNSYTPAFKKFLWMFVGIFGFYGAKLIPESYCGSPEWWNEELWYRIVYLLIAVEVGFTKYYFAWFNGEAHTILIGASYRRNPKTGAVSWDRISMLDLVPFRLAHNRFMIQMNWNICSGEWLKYYVYLRIPREFQKYISPVVITFMTSAFWHGFYPGYYLFFGCYSFYYIVEEAIDLNFRRVYVGPPIEITRNLCLWDILVSYFKKPAPGEKPVRLTAVQLLYIVVMTFCTWVYINTITITFRLLDWERTTIAWGGVYWYVHIIALVLFILFKFVFPAPKPKKVEVEKKVEEKKAQ